MTELVLKKGDQKPEAEVRLQQEGPANLDVTGVSTSNDTFTVDEDRTDYFTPDLIFSVVKSTGNDGEYQVQSRTYNSGSDTTTITVTGDITDSTVDGEISFPDFIPVDLTGASVKFYVTNPGTDEMVIDGENCTILNSEKGRIRYTWDSGDSSTAGLYKGEFIATFSDGDLTFPNNGYIPVIINPDAQGGIQN